MKTNVIAVFDIGKTNKKILLFNEQMKVVFQHEQKFATTVDADGFECDDIEKIETWMKSELETIISGDTYAIQAVNFSTYGASLAFLNAKGERLTPIYNYLKEVNPSIENTLFEAHGGKDEFCRKTASPALGLLLNSGIQMLWLQQSQPELWKEVKDILHFPQYLAYVLKGQVTSEPTSIGCHTFMWDFDRMDYHRWIAEAGIQLPVPQNNDVVATAVLAGEEVQVGVGIHDSSASLVPYLENSAEKFILISTGTWCINMNPYNDEPLTADQLSKDCLCFMTPKKQQVKSSRLFMGHFHEVLVAKLNAYFSMDDNYYKAIPFDAAMIAGLKAKFADTSVFFPYGVTGFDKGLAELDFSVFENFNEAYNRLVMELTELNIQSLNLIIAENDPTGIIYVSGGFARNPIYVNLLSQHFSDKKVFTSEIDNASALGAALVIADNFKNYDTSKVELISEVNV